MVNITELILFVALICVNVVLFIAYVGMLILVNIRNLFRAA